MDRFQEWLAKRGQPQPVEASEPAAPSPAPTPAIPPKDRFQQWLATHGEPQEPEPEPAPPLADLHVEKSGDTLRTVPAHRTRASFSDMPGQSFTAEQLANVKEDKSQQPGMAFVGGALQGATAGFGDELGAAAGSLMGEGSYAGLRAENRAANKTAESWSPNDYALGKLAGGAATIAIPGVAPAGKLLSGANTLRAAAVGGTQALGESKADLTKGSDWWPALKDTAKGAAVGAGANIGLGVIGAGLRGGANYVKGLPAALAHKEDEALIDAATLGAPAAKRDALMGYLGQDRPDVLKMIRANPEIEAALKKGDRETATRLLLADKAKLDERDAGVTAALQQKFGQARAQPIVDKLEARRIAEVANPALESQAAAAKTQKLIDSIKERWIPTPAEPVPEGPALLAKLAEKADTGDKQRIGANAESFLAVAQKHKLGEVANDPIATEARINESLAKLGERREKLYDKVKEPLLITDMTRPLAAWRDELASNGATVDDAANVQGLIKNIWQAHGQDGKLSMSPKEARALISGIQEKAFAGKYIDPGLAKEMQRRAAGVMKDAFDAHVERTTSGNVPTIETAATQAYRGQHRAPTETGAPLHDLTQGSVYPKDVYQTLPEYRTGDAKLDRLAEAKIQLFRGKPDQPITVYRAVPPDVKSIQPGDWVTINKEYALQHAKSTAGPSDDMRVISAKVRARDIHTAGDSLQEWGYNPSVTKATAVTPSKVGQDLAQLNQEYSALLTFKTAAEKRAAEARMVPLAPPEIRTGTAPIAEVRQLARTTEAPEARHAVTAGLHEQLPPQSAEQLAALDRQRDLLARLQAPLEHKAAREASPATTLRHHAHNVMGFLQNQGAMSAGAIGATLAATGHHAFGGSILAAALAAKYGAQTGAQAEKALAAMVQAARMGATPAHLQMIGKAAGLTSKVISELIGTELPRVAASKVVKQFGTELPRVAASKVVKQ